MRTLANPIYGTGVVGKEGRVQGGTSRNGKNRMLRRSLHKSEFLAYRDLLVAAGEQEDIRKFFASDT